MDVEPEATMADSVRGERFRAYVEPELAVLLRVARRLTGSSVDAEDLVQETLIRAYRGIDRFDGRYPRAWLLTILRRTWLNLVRQKRPGPTDDPEFSGRCRPPGGRAHRRRGAGAGRCA